MESIAAIKELLFALGAGLYLLWKRRGYLIEVETERELSVQKELLDTYLEETFEVERKQMHETNPDKLKEFLEDVTNTKLKALEDYPLFDVPKGIQTGTFHRA